LAVVVSHHKTKWCLFDGPGRREAVTVEHAHDRVFFNVRKTSLKTLSILARHRRNEAAPKPNGGRLCYLRWLHSRHPKGLHGTKVPSERFEANIL
jgi:hypothetical protein